MSKVMGSTQIYLGFIGAGQNTREKHLALIDVSKIFVLFFEDQKNIQITYDFQAAR